MMIDPDGYKVTMLPGGSVFTNAKGVFIEYLDLIKAPYRQMLSIFAHKEYDEKSAFDFRRLAGKNEDELTEYYYTRTHRNFLNEFFKEGCSVPPDKLDKVLDVLIEENPDILKISPELRLVDAIKGIITDGILTKHVNIYYPFDNPIVREDVHRIFKDNLYVHFVCGDLETALSELDKDTTYIFSDIMLIDEVKRLDRLELAAIMIPADYGYNMNEEGDLLLDIEEYQKKNTFKFYQFIASAVVEDADEETT